MGFPCKLVVLLLTVSSVFMGKISFSAPVKNARKSNAELEKTLHDFLDVYYENYIKNTKYEHDLLQQNRELERKNNFKGKQDKSVDIYDTMQSDQPVENNNNVLPPSTNFTGNISDASILQASRHRAKDNWIQLLKMNILQQVGRANATVSIQGGIPLNLTQLFPNTPNETNPVEDLISKKIRTFYPSCFIPETAEMEFRNEEKNMNLFFNYSEDQQARKIGTATLRLHRIPVENVGGSSGNRRNCSITTNEEEKRLRISIYWYMKPQRNKRRGKKRLCDSRVISINDHWVELDVASAIRSWTNEENLGLAIQVEDQDGKTLKAEKYFKGPTCLVGVSTPRPIPTILMDNARSPEQLYHLLGRNTTSAFPRDILLLPTIDVCSLGFPVNLSDHDMSNLRTNACNLRAIHAQAQNLLEKDKLERLATLRAELGTSATTNHRHLRHQRNFNYLEEKLAKSDTKILMTKEQMFELLQSLNLTNST